MSFFRAKIQDLATDLAVIYKGLWEEVREDIIPLNPHHEIPLSEAKTFDCKRQTERHPRELKGEDYNETILESDNCNTESCC